MNAYVHSVLSLVTSIYCSVNNTGPRVYICMYRHIKNLSGSVFHAPHNIYICMHASTPGTTVGRRGSDCVRN